MNVGSKKAKKVYAALSHGVLILLAVICLLPIYLVLINAFKPQSEIVRNPMALPTSLELVNFTEAWKSASLGTGYVNSVLLTATAVLIVIVVSTLAGYALTGKRLKNSPSIIFFLMVSMVVPIQMFLFPLYFSFSALDLINSPIAVGLINAALQAPFATLLMRTQFLAVPKDLEEVARIDGANTAQVIWHILRPVVSPGIITVASIVGLRAWNEYLISSTFLQQGASKTVTLGLLAINSEMATNKGPMMAAALLVILPIVIFFISIQKYFIDGMVSGAVKG